MRARVIPERWVEHSSRPLLLSIDMRNGRITAAGELDRAVAHRLTDALHALVQTGHRTWTVDAAAISFCDADGLRALAAGAALAQSKGSRLQVTAPSPFIRQLLGLVGMTDLVDSTADRSPMGAA